MNSYQKVIDAFRDAGLHVDEKGNGRAQAQSPGHSDGDRSVSIAYIEGRTLFQPHAAGESEDKKAVLDAVGLTWADLFDDPKGQTYKYGDGREVHRTPDKRFFQAGNKQGSELYHADRLQGASVVWLVEGEQDVHAVEAAGGVATCNAGGAAKLHNFNLSPLYGKRVIVVRDRDEAGEKHAAQAIELLGGKVMDIKVVLAAEGKDFADHYLAGHGLDDLVEDQDFARKTLVANLKSQLDSTDGLSTDDIISKMYRELDHAAVSTKDDPDDVALHTFDDVALEWWEWLEADADEVVPTPWSYVNETLAGGLHPKRVYFLAGRPGGGKTIGIVNIAEHAAQQQIPGVIYSIEMDRIELMSRIMASGASAEYGQVTKRDLDEYNLTKIANFAEKSSGMPLLISDRARITLEIITEEVRRLKRTHGVRFVCIDYMQIMSYMGTGKKREEQLDEMSWGLHSLAKEANVAIVVAAQLNRDGSKDGRKPQLTDLRGSGSLEQNADVVILIHHELTTDGDATGMCEFIVAKNRTGPTRDISMAFRPHFALISSAHLSPS